LSNTPQHIGLVLWLNPSLPSEMNDTIGQRSRCKLTVQINKIPLNLFHSSISKLEKQMGANVIYFLESNPFTQMRTTAPISCVIIVHITKLTKSALKWNNNAILIILTQNVVLIQRDCMKYYENYLVDVTLSLASDGKKTDDRKWETRTLCDNHVELQSSMSRSRVVDHHGNQSIVKQNLLSVSLEVGPQWNNCISRD
jgi:hypothetical protein